MDEIQVEAEHARRWDQPLKDLMGTIRGGLFGNPAEPPGHPQDMGVGGEGISSQME